jgi:hypothetical protein
MSGDKEYWQLGMVGLGMIMLLVGGILIFNKVLASGVDVDENSMIATLKGSTYGEGEQMTVFGACTDLNGKSIAGVDAYLSALYPNGSIWFADNPMTFVSLGNFKWEGLMGTVGGTYLTLLKCEKSGRTAVAYGEWQNPRWVRQIADGLIAENYTQGLIQDVNGNIIGINTTLVNQGNEILYQQATDTSELQDTLRQVNQTVVDQHNITRSYIQTNSNFTNQLILAATEAANGSVDRNNSLLYRMLYYLMIQSGYPITGNVTGYFYEFDPPQPVYYDYWTVKVRAIDEYNRSIQYPAVVCILSSSLQPDMYMDPVGDHFEATLFVDVLVDVVSVDVSCRRDL